MTEIKMNSEKEKKNRKIIFSTDADDKLGERLSREERGRQL